MRFKIDRNKFQRGIQIVQNIPQSNLSNPILEHMYLAVDASGTVTMRTSNLTLNAICRVEGTVMEPGEIAVPMKEMAQIVKELPIAEVMVEGDEGMIRIDCGPASLRLRGVNADEFPQVTFLENGVELELSASEFGGMVDKTIFATSEDRSRYILEGIKIDAEGQRLKFISTDGKRLSLVERAMEKELEKSVSVLVPGKTMGEIRRIITGEDRIRIKIGEKKIEFFGDDFTLTSNLLVDNFPPYRQLIPSEFTLSFESGTADFLRSVRRASVLVDERTLMVVLEVSPEGILVRGQSQAHGEANTIVDVEYDSEPFKTAFRCDFLQEVLKVLEGEKVRFEFKNPTSPAVIKDSKDPGFLHVLMPLKVEENIAPAAEEQPEDEEEQ
ncbi:MAG TPA: DNA polymerase III subunit beta [bacterium]|nr:DNA polymerase III subunit beta [bacterium]